MVEPSLQSYPLNLTKTKEHQCAEVTVAVFSSSTIKFLLMAQRFQNSTAKKLYSLGVLSTHSCPITMHDRRGWSRVLILKRGTEKAHA